MKANSEGSVGNYFRKHPYLRSEAIGGALGLAALILGLLELGNVLPDKRISTALDAANRHIHAQQQEGR